MPVTDIFSCPSRHHQYAYHVNTLVPISASFMCPSRLFSRANIKAFCREAAMFFFCKSPSANSYKESILVLSGSESLV